MELLLGRAEIGVDRIERDLVRRAALQRCLGEEVEQGRVASPRTPGHEEAASAR